MKSNVLVRKRDKLKTPAAQGHTRREGQEGGEVRVPSLSTRWQPSPLTLLLDLILTVTLPGSCCYCPHFRASAAQGHSRAEAPTQGSPIPAASLALS